MSTLTDDADVFDPKWPMKGFVRVVKRMRAAVALDLEALAELRDLIKANQLPSIFGPLSEEELRSITCPRYCVLDTKVAKREDGAIKRHIDSLCGSMADNPYRRLAAAKAILLAVGARDDDSDRFD